MDGTLWVREGLGTREKEGRHRKGGQEGEDT